jgi:hypothetical protein
MLWIDDRYSKLTVKPIQSNRLFWVARCEEHFELLVRVCESKPHIVEKVHAALYNDSKRRGVLKTPLTTLAIPSYGFKTIQ